MSVFAAIVRRLFAVSAILLLAACGGGGGGGGGGGPGFSVSPGSLTFSTTSASSPTPAPQAINIAVTGGTVYLGAFYSGSAIANATFVITGATTAVVTVYPASPASLGTGTHTGTIRVVGCNDVNCNSPVSGSPKDVTVTYQITDLSASPSSVNLSAMVNTTSAAVPVNISSSMGTAAWSSSISYSGGTTGWLTLSPASGSSLPATLNFSGAAVAVPGTHTANVTITSGSQVRTVPVTYVVNTDLTATPSSVNLSAMVNTTSAAVPVNISVSSSTPGAWSSSISYSGGTTGWLTLSPASGSSLPATLNFSGAAVAVPGTHTANVTITSGSQVRTVPVTLTVIRTQVNYVAPYIAISNTSSEVIIRGDGFNLVSIQNVKFGSTNATTFTVVSNTEIRATHSALTTGSYPVVLESNLGNSPSLATLAVVDAPTYAAATLAYPNATVKLPLEIIYDAERQALVVGVAYATPGANGEIFRYAYSGSAWAATPTSSAIASFRALGLTIDGQKLLAVSDYAITQVDPITIATGTVTNAPFSSFYYLRHVAMANDGYAIVTTGVNGSGYTDSYRYNARSPAFATATGFYFGTPGASADGSKVSIVQGSLSPPPNVAQYNASTGVISNTGLSLNQNSVTPELNRMASRIILNGSFVYDASYTLLGNLPFAAAVALSPDGTRAYSYSSGTVLHTYDLSSAPVAGVFPEIGTGTTLPSNPGTSAKMAISPDGGTVFIAGNNGVVVQPVP